MNTNSAAPDAVIDRVAGGAVSSPDTGSITTIIGGLVVLASFAAPLFLTLPDTMDSATRPRPLISEAGAADVREATFHERHPAHAGAQWADSLDGALAQWRMRASD
jgi:hypothetical protein